MKRKNIFKSLLAAAMALIMIFGAAPLSGFVGIRLPMLSLKAEAATTEDGLFEYAVDRRWTESGYQDGVRIIRCNKKGPGKVVVPETIKGLEVKWIDGAAFGGCTRITSIVIPDSVTSIGVVAFSGCTSLSKVKLSNNLTIIEEGTFRDCTSLKEIVIPDSVTEIRGEWYENGRRHSSAFSGCTSLTKVKLSNNLTIIEERTFFDCTSLAEIVIPDSVTSIGGHAFSCCTSLSKVQLSNNLTIIEAGTFRDCTSLTEIVIPDSVTEIGESAFSGCTSLSKVKLSNNLTRIEVATFYGCTSLAEIVIPDSVTEIRGTGSYYNVNGAFSGCTSLKEIVIPDSVTEIGKYAFSGCTSLSKVKLSNSLMIIEEGTFSDCTSLKEIVIPDSVTEIRGEWYYYHYAGAFSGCTSLKEIVIPDSVTEIGKYAFSGCTSLSKVKLSNSLMIIEEGAFRDCTSLEEIVIPDSVTEIRGENGRHSSAFSGCTSLTKVKLSNNLTIIEAGTFRDCTSLTEITIPDGVTVIRGEWYAYDRHNGAFSGCTSLKEIVIPDSVTEIGDYAFSGCTSLKEIVIPDSVTSIGGSAFSNCISLESITIGSGVESLGDEWIASCRRLESITVSPENKTYSSVDGVLFNKDKSELSAYPIGNKRSSYTIPDGVEKIGKKAFYGCRYIESLTIPVNVIEIDDSAFENCYSLKNVYYLGTRAQWKAVVIGTKNEALTRATVHCIDDPPCDHVWGEWEVVEEATYEKEGLERRACSLCDIEETRVIPKLVRASAIELSESEKTVFVGDTFTITATVKPEDAFNRTVTWSSSDPSIATVDENGTVTAIAKGEAIITAESADGVKAECKVTVEKKVAAIELSESEKTVFVGDTFTITATVKPEDAFNRTVTWSSSDPSIATVDENGTVTAIAEGEAIITAESADGVTAECKVTVEKKDGFFKTLLKIITAPFRAIINLFKKLFGK